MGVPLYPISQTAAAYKIPKAGGDGKIAAGFIPDLSSLYALSGHTHTSLALDDGSAGTPALRFTNGSNWGLYFNSGGASMNLTVAGIALMYMSASGILVAGTGMFSIADALTNSPLNAMTLRHNSSGTPVAGFGSALRFQMGSATQPSRDAGRLRYEWTDPLDASRTAKAILSVVGSASESDILTIAPSGATVQMTDTGTNTTPTLAILRHLTSGTSTNGFGVSMDFDGEDLSGATVLLGRVKAKFLGNHATLPTSQLIFSVRNCSDVYGTGELELLKVGATPNAYNGGVQIMNPLLNTAYFEFVGVAADGRQALYHYSDATRKQVFAARAGLQSFGPGTNFSIAGLSGSFGIYLDVLSLGSPVFGQSVPGAGTHKSMLITTPESVPVGVSGWTRTDMIDFVTFSVASNTWGGVRPNMRYTALEHIFRVDGGTGQANPGTDIFRIQSTGVRVESTLAFHLGDPTVDGTWRIVRSGNDLLMQRRESGSWVTKQTIAA